MVVVVLDRRLPIPSHPLLTAAIQPRKTVRQTTPLPEINAMVVQLPAEIQDLIFRDLVVLPFDYVNKIVIKFNPNRGLHGSNWPQICVVNLPTEFKQLQTLRLVSRAVGQRATDIFCRENRIEIQTLLPSQPLPQDDDGPWDMLPSVCYELPKISPLLRDIYRDARKLEIYCQISELFAVVTSMSQCAGGPMATRTLTFHMGSERWLDISWAERMNSIKLKKWLPAFDQGQFPRLENVVFRPQFSILPRIQLPRNDVDGRNNAEILQDFCRLMRNLTPVLPPRCRVFLHGRGGNSSTHIVDSKGLPRKPLLSLVPIADNDLPYYSTADNASGDLELNMTNKPSDVWLKLKDWIGVKHHRYRVELSPGLTEADAAHVEDFASPLYHQGLSYRPTERIGVQENTEWAF
ncbi:hypothetical protein QBC44DRAFT_111834 [Cladorrhinum sp. PSN332]|nr:hypothetical protein QBC44DRAFT_111834 [Cladorrhinum sp. PSN332]